MIKYNLNCKNCLNSFDSWFASSKEFEKLRKASFLNCPECDSYNVVKSLMAPTVLNSKKNKINVKNIKHREVKKKIKEYQKFVKENFDYVGENFSYEARSIHYSNKKIKKGIYGKASINEAKELKEEGIETEVIPWIEDKEN